MNFDLNEEQQMIMDQAAKFVANESPVSRFRKLRETERMLYLITGYHKE